MDLGGDETWGSADMALWLGSKGKVDNPVELLDPVLKVAKDTDDDSYTSRRWPNFYDDIRAHSPEKGCAVML